MTFLAKSFPELTVEELFEIYRLRAAVFVVEQRCAYQDPDEFDPAAVHLLLLDGRELVGYLRVLPRGTVFDEVSIGRVISVRRRRGIGTELVREGIRLARERFGAERIDIEAQVYAKGLYEKLGFRQTSGEFLEDGIPHVRMRLEC